MKINKFLIKIYKKLNNNINKQLIVYKILIKIVKMKLNY